MSPPPQFSNNNSPDGESLSGRTRIQHPGADGGPAGGGCPIAEPTKEDDGRSASVWGRWLSSSSWWNNNNKSNNPTTSAKVVLLEQKQYGSCPAATSAGQPGLFGVTAASVEEAARHAQTPQPDQTVLLDRERQVSSIPRHGRAGDSNLPHHQHTTTTTPSITTATTNNNNESPPLPNKWVYPSEQQLYNAMRKKGWSNVPEESIPTVLQIHNHINEHTWRQIRAWEGFVSETENDSDALVLTRFQGRPRDLTPKAFFLSRICGRSPPFDRHDWYVQRQSSSQSPSSPSTSVEQRYVIDYYYLPARQPGLPPIPYIDARPAWIDRPFRALYLHARWWGQWAFPGIATYLQQQPPRPQRQVPTSSSPNNNKNNQIHPQPQTEQQQ